MPEKDGARPAMISRTEMRKRLTLESFTSPGGIDTSLSRIGQPIRPAGEHLSEDEPRSDGTTKSHEHSFPHAR